MKPKYQQTWNENVSSLKINIKYEKPVLIEVLKQSGEKVNENEPIGAYSYDGQKKNIISTFNGYIAWSQNSTSFEIISEDQFQTVGIIYKNKADLPQNNQVFKQIFLKQEDIEYNSTSSSIQPSNNYNKLNYMQMASKNCIGNITLIKWKVNPGDFISPSMVLGICIEENGTETIDLKSKIRGKIIELAKTKTQYQKDEPLIILDGMQICNHLKIESSVCLFCNEKVVRSAETQDLNYSDHMLQKISKEIVIDILNKKKLIMVLDLDQTILHAIKISPNFNTAEFCEKSNKLSLQDDENMLFNDFNQLGFNIQEHFLEMYCDSTSKFIIKLRPYFEQFFLTLIPLYDIYIYTKASRSYADFILGYIENRLKEVIPEHQPFFPPNRVFSREDTICTNSKSLNRLFYPGIASNLLVILDDNAGMWSQFKDNLIHTKPFVYFNEHSLSKDGQGINIEVENEVEISNKFDFWLYTTTLKLKEISDRFWGHIQIAQDDPNFVAEFELQVCKAKKVKTGIIEEATKVEERTMLDLITNRKISAPMIYADIRNAVLKGVTLFFAISEAHEEKVKKGLELAKEKAFYLGAKIFREFKENEFIGQDNCYLITVGRRKIKSIIIASEKQIPIVHYKWIEDCDNYLYRADYKNYLENDNGENTHLHQESQRDKILKSQLIQK